MNPGDSVQQGAETSIVGAADSSHNSRVPAWASFVQVTANTNDTDDWIVLPTGVKPGHVVRGWSVPAHEMRTEAASGILINGVDSDGTQEAAIPATSLWRATYVNATIGWILEVTSELGAVVTAVVPD